MNTADLVRNFKVARRDVKLLELAALKTARRRADGSLTSTEIQRVTGTEEIFAARAILRGWRGQLVNALSKEYEAAIFELEARWLGEYGIASDDVAELRSMAIQAFNEGEIG